MTELNYQQWDKFLEDFSDIHLLQTSAWGRLKSAFNWSPAYVQAEQAGAQILFRKLPLGFTIGYIPKGPVGTDWQALWPEVDRICREKKAIFLQVEPDALEPAENGLQAVFEGFRPSISAIQPRRTIIVDLKGSEDDILKRMKQKTRYNIRLAGRKGVVVRQISDLSIFQQLMDITGTRDGFGVHSMDYYQRAFDLFSPQGKCALLVAEYEDKPLAALMVFQQGKRAWYFYGASSNEERNRMPTYLLQWEAIRWAIAKGCTEYDLWGVPDASEEDLEANFKSRSDGLWGVYRFKRGFGGQLVRSVGSWDRVYMPALYKLYRTWAERR